MLQASIRWRGTEVIFRLRTPAGKLMCLLMKIDEGDVALCRRHARKLAR